MEATLTIAPPPSSRAGEGGLAHEEGAGEVHVEDLLPVLEADLVAVLEAQDAGAS